MKFALEPGYAVVEAADGRDAIMQIRQKLPDLILMDVQMPDMDGYETLHEIRAHPESAACSSYRRDGLRHARRSAEGIRGWV